MVAVRLNAAAAEAASGGTSFAKSIVFIGVLGISCVSAPKIGR
jgi:hypothetical protein